MVVALLCKEIEDPLELRCLKGDSGDQGPSGRHGPAGKGGAVMPGGPPGKIGQIVPPGTIESKGSVGARGGKGDKGDVDGIGPPGPPGPIGGKGSVGARGEKGDKGDDGGIGTQGLVGPQGSTGQRGVRGVRGVASPDGLRGPASVKCDRGPQGPVGIQGIVGDQGDRGERGERVERGEKGIQGGTSDVLSVLAAHIPIQLAKRYGEKCALSSIMYQRTSRALWNRLVECKRCVMLMHTMNPHGILVLHLSVGVYIKGQTCRKLQVMGTFWRCRIQRTIALMISLITKWNAIYIVYKIGDYDNTGAEHNPRFSSGTSDNHRGVCFLKDERTMRMYGIARVIPITIWIFQISLPVIIIHVKRINGTLFV